MSCTSPRFLHGSVVSDIVRHLTCRRLFRYCEEEDDFDLARIAGSFSAVPVLPPQTADWTSSTPSEKLTDAGEGERSLDGGASPIKRSDKVILVDCTLPLLTLPLHLHICFTDRAATQGTAPTIRRTR